MRGSRVLLLIGVILVGQAIAPPSADAKIDPNGAFWKLSRGFVNIVTGWVEIPKRVYETTQQSSPFAGFTWGAIRGIGHGFVRTAAGFYELFTFPFAAPENYEPVIQPEFVFGEQSPAYVPPAERRYTK